MLYSLLNNPKYLGLNLEPLIIPLQSKYFDKARKISEKVTGERNQWKTYLSAIALFAFEEYLQELIPDIQFDINDVSIFQLQHQNLTDTVCNTQLSNFKLCLITTDNLVDDWITVPEKIINSPKLAGHLYVLLEIMEAEKQLIIHGFMYRDEILKYQESVNITSTTQDNKSIKIPFSRFDPEINNLLICCRLLKPEAINLPKDDTIAPVVIANIHKASHAIAQSLVNLGQWGNGIFEEGWESLEEILTLQMPDPVYLRNKNYPEYPIQKGKLFDFGSLLNNKKFALVVKMKPEENEEKGVIVQIRPENEYCLPQGLKLKVTLNHNTNEVESEEAIATESDCIIQLGFCESPGKQFKVEAIYQDAVLTEEFVL
ncbi:DUF1822 family protein [Mastigocoleus testarum]|uniref:DUF1822 domain-containing protein n=1 Tax=Mastigocoleus testarum BC008 TaxID=371196 RepID=A0A0V7ZXW5_9CYAN|nr:DUF1822 family protein [Mastigocoleus testarum]KST69417.1 hypothetical protein BC008_35440 [Mastigocoleus testarum BC008]